MDYLLFLFLGKLIEDRGSYDDNAYDDKYAYHSCYEVGQVDYEEPGFKEEIHFSLPPSSKEIEYKTARYNGSDLSGYVDADCRHKKEVLVVCLKSHLVYNSTRHREG